MIGPCAIVAIPAKDEAGHIGACLRALASQRGLAGRNLPSGTFAVVLFVNNSTDATAAQAGTLRPDLNFALHVVGIDLPTADANAGGARRRAMNIAAEMLEASGRHNGVLLTTDADTSVPSDWIARNLSILAEGLDAVAGTFVLDPADEARLPVALRERGRYEYRYRRLLWEMEARLDPIQHDPWPRHGIASRASLALTLASYRAVGGVPLLSLGEDKALVATLRQHGFRVRHEPSIKVVTSGRLVGRAAGGAADTMRRRIEDVTAPCDDDMESALRAFRRYFRSGRRRRNATVNSSHEVMSHWLDAPLFPDASAQPAPLGPPLRVSDLPVQICTATVLVQMLRLVDRLRSVFCKPSPPQAVQHPRPSTHLNEGSVELDRLQGATSVPPTIKTWSPLYHRKPKGLQRTRSTACKRTLP